MLSFNENLVDFFLYSTSQEEGLDQINMLCMNGNMSTILDNHLFQTMSLTCRGLTTMLFEAVAAVAVLLGPAITVGTVPILELDGPAPGALYSIRISHSNDVKSSKPWHKLHVQVKTLHVQGTPRLLCLMAKNAVPYCKLPNWLYMYAESS